MGGPRVYVIFFYDRAVMMLDKIRSNRERVVPCTECIQVKNVLSSCL